MISLPSPLKTRISTSGSSEDPDPSIVRSALGPENRKRLESCFFPAQHLENTHFYVAFAAIALIKAERAIASEALVA